MEKSKKFYLFFFILFIFFEFFLSESLTNEDTKFLSFINGGHTKQIRVQVNHGTIYDHPYDDHERISR